MEDYFAAQALTGASGRKYAQSEAPKKISVAPSVPREGLEDVGGSDEEVLQHSKSRTQTLQALGIARGQCTMKPEEKIEEGGKKALAHNRTAQMMARGYGNKEIHLVGVIATCNSKPAGAREVVTKYIKEPEDMKFLGGGVWALRRHGGTIVVICGVKRRDFKKMRVLLAAAGIFVPDVNHLKRCRFFGGAMSKRERLSRAKKKIPYIRSETEIK
jgi:hypothetical protein